MHVEALVWSIHVMMCSVCIIIEAHHQLANQQVSHIRCRMIPHLTADPVPCLTIHQSQSTQFTKATHPSYPTTISQLLTWLASALETTPHVEFLLRWVQQLLMQHGSALQSGAVGRLGSARVAPALRAVHAAATRIHKSVGATAQANINTLEFLSVPREEATD